MGGRQRTTLFMVKEAATSSGHGKTSAQQQKKAKK